MDKNKLRTVIFALIFGLVATLMAAVYIGSMRANLQEQGEQVSVLVAAVPVPAGTAADALLARNLVEKREYPRRYLASDALSTIDSVKNKVLVASLSPGDQVTAGKFRSSDKAEVAVRLSGGKVAVAVPVDESVGVAGQIRAGDRVAVYATFKPGPGGTDRTQQLLSGVEVLAALGSDQTRGMASSAQARRTLTLAVTPAEAEKMVFAQEKGHLWFGLLPASGETPGRMPGQTIDTVFQ